MTVEDVQCSGSKIDTEGRLCFVRDGKQQLEEAIDSFTLACRGDARGESIVKKLKELLNGIVGVTVERWERSLERELQDNDSVDGSEE